jgi:hypothetical protein
MVQTFAGRTLRYSALTGGSRRTQFDMSGGKALGSFRQSRGAGSPGPDSRAVQHVQLAAETFDPMPCLCAGVVEAATTVSACRQHEGGDNNYEHDRNHQDRGQQDRGHRLDSTRGVTLIVSVRLELHGTLNRRQTVNAPPSWASERPRTSWAMRCASDACW